MAITRRSNNRQPRLFRAAANIPALPGAYVLVIALARPLEVAIGGGTPQRLAPGRYLYCGSARGPGGLKARIARHMRCGKPVRWHVDRLTEHGSVRGVWIFPAGDECALAARLEHFQAKWTPVRRPNMRPRSENETTRREAERIPILSKRDSLQRLPLQTPQALAATGLRSPPSAWLTIACASDTMVWRCFSSRKLSA